MRDARDDPDDGSVPPGTVNFVRGPARSAGRKLLGPRGGGAPQSERGDGSAGTREEPPGRGVELAPNERVTKLRASGAPL